MSNKETIKMAVNALGAKKNTFLNDIESSIKSHISAKSPLECLTINQLYSYGGVKSTWKPEVSKAYFKRLSAFLQKKKFEGYNLDSKLTPGVVDLVNKKFNEFYSSNADLLVEPLKEQLMKDQVFVEKLIETIINSTKEPFPAAIKKHLTENLVHILQQTMGVNIGHDIGHGISIVLAKTISATVALNISTSVMTAVLHHVALALKGTIAQVLASTAFKSTIVAFIKKLLAIKIVAFLAAFVSAVPVLGPAIAAAPLYVIVAPVLAGFIYYQISSLPENMAESVSVAVRQELSGEFEKLNTEVTTQIFESFGKDALGSLVSDIAAEVANDSTFKDALDELNKK